MRKDYWAVDVLLRGLKPSKKKSTISKYQMIAKIGRIDFLRRILDSNSAFFQRVYYPYLVGGGKKRQKFLRGVMHIRNSRTAKTLALQRLLKSEEFYIRSIIGLKG